MKTTHLKSTQQIQINLAIDPEKLEDLLRAGYLAASDFNCLDNHSKQGVWALLRSVTASKLV
jgi:hypothetical protein